MSTKYVNKIYERELLELLKVDRRGLQKLHKREDLPAPQDEDAEGAFWSIPVIRAWLNTGRRRPRELTLDWWPDAEEPAEYFGATVFRRSGPDTEPSAVLQHWNTTSGQIVVAWPLGDPVFPVNGEDLARVAPEAAAYLRVGPGWGIDGPDLFTWTRSAPRSEADEVEWADLARVLGRPAPYWPSNVRLAELITEWQPGDRVVRHHGTTGVDVVPLLQMAIRYPAGHPVHRTLIHAAQTITARESIFFEGDLLEERLRGQRITAEQIEFAAVPAPPPAAPEELDETTRRIGWRELLQRDDRLAEQCLDTLFAWNGGDDLPHAHVIDIALDGAWGAEFCARLEPATRTAQYLILDRQREGEAMVDPLTDTPVVINTAEGTARALAPNRLPATSPLAELILDNPVWVRTADGTLYPAPHDPSYGLSWGYGGSGPTALALLAGKLLDDVTAPGAQLGNETPARGLLELFRRELKATTVLTRADLEAARNSSSS